MTFEKLLEFFPRWWETIWDSFPAIMDWFTAELNSAQQSVFGVTYRFEIIIGAGLTIILGAIIIKWIAGFIT